MTADMSISLKVVSMAAVCCASTSRLAMVWRRRDMRTRSSRADRAARGAGRATGCRRLRCDGGAAGATAARRRRERLARAAMREISSRVTRPPGPVPATSLRSILCSSANVRTAGAARTGAFERRALRLLRGGGPPASRLPRAGAGAGRRFHGAACGRAIAGGRALRPMVPSTSPTVTISPSLLVDRARARRPPRR